MSEFKPERSKENLLYDDIGSISSDFEAFKPNPKFSWEGRVNPPNEVWQFVTPRTTPPVGDLPKIIQNIFERTWKSAEPSAGGARVNSKGTPGLGAVIGTRNQGVPNGYRAQTYHPQVRPTNQGYITTMPNKSAIASDWKVFEQIKRINTVSFRGDSRPPGEIIGNMGGFTPPNSRTDRYYLENNIFNTFSDYLNRRYARTLDKNTFLGAVDAAAPTAEQKKLLVDYLMWRRIMEGEAVHLGRMVENECEKGYISTSRAIGSSLTFATRYGKAPGWVYVTVVHGGFVIPYGDRRSGINWSSLEAEIAQWGPIPSSRIVGFYGVTSDFEPRTDIYFRRSFRKSENAAFKYMFNVMSGMTPDSPGYKPPA